MNSQKYVQQLWHWLSTFRRARLPAKACAGTLAADAAVTYANAFGSSDISYTEGYFGKGETRLHYVEAGNGPLILFYHGFPSFWFSFFKQMELLKGRYHVVAVDGLGAGLSAKPESLPPYRIDKLAAQIDALARHLAGDESFILIGHDWGAALSFAYAQAYPARLRAVVGMSAPPFNLFVDLVRDNAEQQARSGYMQVFRTLSLASIAATGAPERIWQQAYDGLMTSGALNEAEGQLFRAALSDPYAINGGMNWYRANLINFADISQSQHWPAGGRIVVPALLIWGDADKTFVPEFLERMPEYAPGISIVQAPGVGHWASMDRPEMANKAIEEFLQQF